MFKALCKYWRIGEMLNRYLLSTTVRLAWGNGQVQLGSSPLVQAVTEKAPYFQGAFTATSKGNRVQGPYVSYTCLFTSRKRPFRLSPSKTSIQKSVSPLMESKLCIQLNKEPSKKVCISTKDIKCINFILVQKEKKKPL